jgi:hypothetical protein
MNWKQMKDFCNKLPEEVLQNKVIIWQEENAINEIRPLILDQDHYLDPENYEYGCFPESEASEPISNLNKVYSKGDPILIENF